MSLLRDPKGDLGVRPGEAAIYRRHFVTVVHRVLAGAYLLLDPATLATKEETAITGLLVDAMRSLLDSREYPDGAHFFDVHDDRPVSAPGVEGKKRGRIDFVVVDTNPRPRPTYSFEAKRLNDSGSVAKYLGRDGLGCLLSGKYAKDEPDAGMLGYVQADQPSEWAERIAKKLDKERKKHGLSPTGHIWDAHVLVSQLPHSYRSRHTRNGKAFEVSHVLLLCK